MRLSQREKEILLTLKIFDFFQKPATNFEIWKNLVKLNKKNTAPDLKEIIFLLEKSKKLKTFIEKKFGFYFLKNNQEKALPEKRIFQEILFVKKYEKLKKRIKFLRYLPFLKGAFVVGSMALGNVKKESDFDLLLIGKKGRIWTLRFLTLTLYEILGARRKGLTHSLKTSENKICLSCFISEKNLKAFLPNYFRAFEFLNLVFIYGSKDFYLEFLKKNHWLKNFFYQKSLEIETRALFKESIFKKILEKLLEGKFGDFIEKFLKKIQTKRINGFLKNYQSEAPRRIAVSDKKIEIHLDVSKEINLEKMVKKFNKAFS